MDRDQISILKRTVSIEEVERVLSKISTELLLQNNLGCFLLCAEYHRPVFYRKIIAEFGVEIAFFSSDSIVKNIVRRLFGNPAVIIVRDYSKIKEVFLKISEQAMATIYIYGDSNAPNVSNLILQDQSKIDEVISINGNYFKYLIDEDSAKDEGDILEVVEYGKFFSSKFVQSLGIIGENSFG